MIEESHCASRRIVHWSGWVAVLLSALLAGCSGGVGGQVADLVNAPGILPPAQGATQLANTRWAGSQTCELLGDIASLPGIIELPLTPAGNDSLEFDSDGFPLGGSFPPPPDDEPAPVGLGLEWKRANFTPTSFDVAYAGAATLPGAFPATGFSQESAVTLEGSLSSDGEQLTGTRWMGAVYHAQGATFTGAVNCSFTLTRIEGF